MKLSIDKLTVRQLHDFVMNAREKDLEEFYIPLKQAFIDTPLEEFNTALCLRDELGDVYCIWGVEDTEDIDDIIWMLCTDKVEKHPVAYLRFCKEYLKGLLKDHKILCNYVWLGNDLHVKWLKWMGAKFGETIIINGEPFQYFYFMKE